ncbi:MAG: M14 family metallopeptidase, partial [Chitinophagaceae bacterium]
GRKQLVLIITSPKNHQQLASIQQKHVQWSENAKMAETVNNDMPVVMLIGHSIHGNESSGSNASLLTAYYLAAATGDAIENTLQNAVILLDPSFNPDGLNRFATWVNMHKGQQLVSDPQSREFQEVWPGGRFNHYWFDLNRDWLPAQHVESQNRLAFYHQWKPNILTDHHEQGSNATFFFQPGVPSRVNPNTPEKNQVLTGLIGNFHARALDSIGSLYFTKEGYDDFYYGKGSTYPDINGSIGILFEQASSRGHLQETDNGLLSFPATIRNQFVTALSTIQAGVAMRKELLTYQRGFYKESSKEAAAFGAKSFVFSEPNDKTRADKFIEMLLRHQIDVYALKQSVDLEGKRFDAVKSYLVPTDQTQFKLIKTIFERNFSYKDSLFYDVTAWTMPLAFGLQYASVTQDAANLMGEKITKTPAKNGFVAGESKYAYLFEWNDLDAPKVLFALQQKGIICKVATQKLTAANGMSFNYGAIQVPVAIQSMDGAALYSLLTSVVKNTNVTIHAVGSGLSVSGIDLGSNSWQLVKKPQVMLFTGAGTNALDVGEIWHMLDTRMQIPV